MRGATHLTRPCPPRLFPTAALDRGGGKRRGRRRKEALVTHSLELNRLHCCSAFPPFLPLTAPPASLSTRLESARRVTLQRVDSTPPPLFSPPLPRSDPSQHGPSLCVCCCCSHLCVCAVRSSAAAVCWCERSAVAALLLSSLWRFLPPSLAAAPQRPAPSSLITSGRGAHQCVRTEKGYTALCRSRRIALQQRRWRGRRGRGVREEDRAAAPLLLLSSPPRSLLQPHQPA